MYRPVNKNRPVRLNCRSHNNRITPVLMGPLDIRLREIGCLNPLK